MIVNAVIPVAGEEFAGYIYRYRVTNASGYSVSVRFTSDDDLDKTRIDGEDVIRSAFFPAAYTTPHYLASPPAPLTAGASNATACISAVRRLPDGRDVNVGMRIEPIEQLTRTREGYLCITKTVVIGE